MARYGQVLISKAGKEDIPAMTDLLGALFSMEADFQEDHTLQKQGLLLLLERPPEERCVLVASLAGAVSQRACVFCGSRVVLYPIADALHLVHGPIGCATYTWDIRGPSPRARSCIGSELFHGSAGDGRHLRRREEARSRSARTHRPAQPQGRLRLFDLHRRPHRRRHGGRVPPCLGEDTGIPVLPVMSEGFKGNKREGYAAACKAMFRLVGTGDTAGHLAHEREHPGRLQPGG
jgi:hypothetical protein